MAIACFTGRPLELALLLLLATLWGASFTFIKVGVETLPPLTLIAGRTSIAALTLLAVLRYRRVALPRDPALWRQFLIQALQLHPAPHGQNVAQCCSCVQ